MLGGKQFGRSSRRMEDNGESCLSRTSSLHSWHSGTESEIQTFLALKVIDNAYIFTSDL